MDGLFAREAGGFDEAEPLFDAAGFGAVAVVIDDAFAPGEAEGGIFGAREDGGVFDGDAALVVVAIEGPGLELAAGEFAFVHQEMERMLVVVALFADGVEAGDEFVGRRGSFSLDVIRRRAGARFAQGAFIMFELHAIVSDFEAGIQDGAMFGTVFVEDGIGVVDVDQDAAAL